MNNTRFGALVIVGLVVVVIGLSAFTVNERELALKLRFGDIRQANYEPGLKFKIPLIETVVKFPRRILKIDEPSRPWKRSISLATGFPSSESITTTSSGSVTRR